MKKLKLGIALTCSCAFLFLISPNVEAKKLELADGKLLIGAQVRFRYEHFDDTDFVGANDRRDFVLTRIRPDVEYRPHEQIVLFFQPQFTAGWGETGLSQSSVNAATDGSTAATSGALDDPDLGVHQGYLIYAPSDWFAMKLGRQELIYGDHLLVGNVDWNNVARSFDAAKLIFTHDQGWVDLFWSLLSDAESGQARGVATGSSGDAHFMGVYSSLDFGRFLRALDLYALYRLDMTASPDPHNYVTAGLRIQSKPNNWDYRIEGTGQFGKQTGANQRDWQFDVEGGVTFESLYQFRIGLEGFISSLNYNQLFPTAHKWLGFIDLFGRRNIMGGVLHLSAKPAPKWLLKLDAHTMFRAKTSAGLFRLNGVTPIGAVGPSSSHFAGEEIDLTAVYKPLDLLSFKAGFSVFLPAGFIKSNVGSELPLFGYLQTKVAF